MVHSFAPLEDSNPLDNLCCKNIIEAAKRKRETPILKKEPITTELLNKIIGKFAPSGAFLKDLRIAALYTLGIAVFFFSF